MKREVTFAIITFYNLISAWIIPFVCMYFNPLSNCLVTSITSFSLKVPKRCLSAKRDSSANSNIKLTCVSDW
jgi:hypothetical protein